MSKVRKAVTNAIQGVKTSTARIPGFFAKGKSNGIVLYCESKNIIVAYHMKSLAGKSLQALHLMDHVQGVMIFSDRNIGIPRTGTFKEFAPFMRKYQIELKRTPLNIHVIEVGLKVQKDQLAKLVLSKDGFVKLIGLSITEERRLAA